MTRKHGYRSLTRSMSRKHPRERGMRPLSTYLISYKVGDLVDIKIDFSHHNGMPHRRFQGKTGRITEMRGNSFVIAVKDQNKMKTVICPREHFKLNFVSAQQKALEEAE